MGSSAAHGNGSNRWRLTACKISDPNAAEATVCVLILPPQDAYSPACQSTIDETLSFCPAHSLAAHRPLGSILRARREPCEVLGTARRRENGRTAAEPRSLADLPA